jgi:DNA-binding GntR family transcriptional regulator
MRMHAAPPSPDLARPARKPKTAPARERKTAPAHAAVADRLRHDIIYCRWVAGQWLKQADLEAEYGASRSEVRAALAEVQRRGLVVHELNRGYRVEPVDPGRRAEIRATRAALESATVDGILANAGAADIARLRELATEFAGAIGDQPLPRLIAINHEFHTTLYRLCGNTFLSDLIGELRARSNTASAGRWTTARGILGAADEHLAMVDAIAAGDAARLRALITAHVVAF